MPTIPIALTDLQLTMLTWAADQRKISVAQLLADTLGEHLRVLDSTFRAIKRNEAFNLFTALPVERQLDFLETLKADVKAAAAAEEIIP